MYINCINTFQVSRCGAILFGNDSADGQRMPCFVDWWDVDKLDMAAAYLTPFQSGVCGRIWYRETTRRKERRHFRRVIWDKFNATYDFTPSHVFIVTYYNVDTTIDPFCSDNVWTSIRKRSLFPGKYHQLEDCCPDHYVSELVNYLSSSIFIHLLRKLDH